jgi:hypothetical protein
MKPDFMSPSEMLERLKKGEGPVSILNDRWERTVALIRAYKENPDNDLEFQLMNLIYNNTITCPFYLTDISNPIDPCDRCKIDCRELWNKFDTNYKLWHEGDSSKIDNLFYYASKILILVRTLCKEREEDFMDG